MVWKLLFKRSSASRGGGWHRTGSLRALKLGGGAAFALVVAMLGNGDNALANPTGFACTEQSRSWTFNAGTPLAGTPKRISARGRGSSGGGVVVGSQEGYVHRLSWTGQFLWSYTLDASLAYGVAADDWNRTLAVSQQGTLYALRADGAADWVYHGARTPDSSLLPGAKGLLYFVSNKTLVAASVRGGLLWSAFLGAPLAAQPAVDRRGAPWLLTTDGALHHFPGPGSQRKYSLPAGRAGQLVIRGSELYVLQGGVLMRVAPDSGEILWTAPGVRFMSAGEGELGAVFDNHTAAWLNPETGDVAAISPVSADPSAPPIFLPEIAFIPSVDGTLWAVRSPVDARRGPRAAQCPIGNGPVSTPALRDDHSMMVVGAGDGTVVALPIPPRLRATR